ncbi:MAG TPA: hypothetical protein VGI17_07155 [Solirubrobacterales bacterium]
MTKRILVPLALLAVAALALSACGGGGGGGGDEDKVGEAIEAAMTASHPSKCTEFETQRFVEQNSDQKGKEALESCEEEAKEGKEEAKAAHVSNVAVNGSKATAEVELEGGGFDGQTLEVALVEEGGQWRLDHIEGFARYDGAALAKAFEKQLSQEEGLSKAELTCIVEGFAKAGKAKAEELLLSGSPEPIVGLAMGCA